MNNIDQINIDECCDILDNQRIPLNSEQRDLIPGDIPYYGANGIQGYINDFIFDDDLILIAEDGGNFEQYNTRPIAYKISGKSWVNNHAHILKAKEGINQDYIFYSLEHKDIIKFIKGGTRSKLNQAELKEIPIWNPPYNQQQKIAKILTTIDQLIEKTQALIDKHTAIKQGMMADLFTRGIDLITGQLRPPVEQAPHLYKETELGWVPKEWGINDFSDVADIIDPQPDHRTPPEAENGVPYIGVSDFLADGALDIDSARKIIPEAYTKQNKRFKVDKGDIIFGKIGTIGEPKYLLQTEGFALSANIVLIKPKINPEYILSYLDTDIFNMQVKLSINTTSQPALGIEKIRSLKVLSPPGEEISHIANILQNIRSKHNIQSQFLLKQRNMKDGLMQDLLTGKVSV